MLSRAIAITVLMLLVSGCAKDNLIEGSSAAVYDNLDPLVDDLADALIEDGGPKSVVTGQKFIAAYDAGRPQ